MPGTANKVGSFAAAGLEHTRCNVMQIRQTEALKVAHFRHD